MKNEVGKMTEKVEYKEAEKIKIIMDCDPGVDDGIALALIAAHPEVFELLAVTTVCGNQSIEKVTVNALDLTDFYNLQVPVAKGMDGPLVRKPHYAPEVHGETGLGFCVLPRSQKEPQRDMAVFYLHKILTALPKGEKAALLATGPLTNIALLLKLFPEVKEKLSGILFMGGAAQGGNVTPAAEFNIYADPEAAKIVFHSGVPLTMFGLDVTLSCTLTRSQILKMCQSQNPVAKACGDMAGFNLENTANKYRGMVSIHDAAPVMYLLRPEIFKGEKAVLDVDCSDGASLGHTICDFRWWRYEPEEMDALIILSADTEKFQEYLLLSLFELGDALNAKTEKE